MLLITGDIHGDIDIHKLNRKSLPRYSELTKDDFVIICGDFGLVWDDSRQDMYWRKWLSEKPFTTLFVDGNHENFDLLNSYPVTEWHGGKVHMITDSIIHLMRGQAFEVCGRSIFTIGGASSHDIEIRREGVSWWRGELPSDGEYTEALRTLEAHDYTFDYVVSHCAPGEVQQEIAGIKGSSDYKPDCLTDFLSQIGQKMKYERWFCGHYHVEMHSTVMPGLTVLYNNRQPLKTTPKFTLSEKYTIFLAIQPYYKP